MPAIERPHHGPVTQRPPGVAPALRHVSGSTPSAPAGTGAPRRSLRAGARPRRPWSLCTTTPETSRAHGRTTRRDRAAAGGTPQRRGPVRPQEPTRSASGTRKARCCSHHEQAVATSFSTTSRYAAPVERGQAGGRVEPRTARPSTLPEATGRPRRLPARSPPKTPAASAAAETITTSSHGPPPPIPRSQSRSGRPRDPGHARSTSSTYTPGATSTLHTSTVCPRTASA